MNMRENDRAAWLHGPLDLCLEVARGRNRGELRLGHKFNSVKIKSAVPDDTADSVPLSRVRRLKLDFNVRSDSQVGHCEQAHTAQADVHTQRFDV